MSVKGRILRAIAILLVIPVALGILTAVCPPQYDETYLAALRDKAALLDADSSSPRIVLIGGSGTAFAVDSPLLEEQVPGYEAVNFGLYADLGTTVMLELALPSLRAGDVVIFSPELSGQTYSDWFDGQRMWQAAEGDFSLLTRLRPSRWEEMAASFFPYALQKISFWLSGDKPGGEGVYARKAFTPQGDIVPDMRERNRMLGGWDTNAPLGFDGVEPTAEWLTCLRDFAKACEQRRVRVLFRFCPMNAAAFTEEAWAGAEAFAARMASLLPCPILGSLERSRMDAVWFYDTNYHLNGAGSRMNTLLLAEELREVLSITDPVPDEGWPEAPALEEERFDEAAEVADAWFQYRRESEGLAVVSLTEAGRASERLIIPDSVEGVPVVSLERRALDGAENLRELRLPGSIRLLEDGAFTGCSALRQVILPLDNPGDCQVGGALLEGSAAEIYVPESAYGTYCTHYFWARYAPRLRPLTGDKAGAEEHEAPAEISPAEESSSSSAGELSAISYWVNGGRLRTGTGECITREATRAHQRENSLQGTAWMEREEYTLTGWNTQADGSGIRVGLGSRVPVEAGDTLYAQWMAWSPASDFCWEEEASGLRVTGYLGDGRTVVIPETLNEKPVRTIGAGAFSGVTMERLVTPPSLRRVEEGAFQDCDIEEWTLFDSLEEICDNALVGNCFLKTLRINAATRPVYSGTYFDTFQDKLDRLISLRGQRKLVLSSGSSGRYGYDSILLKEAFPELEPVNMGVYAYTNALPQLMLMLRQMEPGDVLLYGPEFDAVTEQFCATNRLDFCFWAMMESNYDAAAGLDMDAFSGVLDSLGDYLRQRSRMPGRGYEVSASGYDDDGNAYNFPTYNVYGDFVLPRPLGNTDERLRHNIADYTLASFSEETVSSLNAALRPFTERGMEVLFTYTPRNSASLTEESTSEARAALERFLRETLEVPVISALEDSLLPGRYFWLIDSHTGTEGAILRTRQVIDDLNNYWTDKEDHP